MTWLGRLTIAAALAGGVLACDPGTPGNEDEAVFDDGYGEIEELQEPLSGVTCAGGAAACSNDGLSGVYTSVYRASASSLSVGEVVQTFTNIAGTPDKVKLRLRLLRDLPGGAVPQVRLALRQVSSGTVPVTTASDLARANVAADTLSRLRAADVEFVLAPTGAPVTLVASNTYALVVIADPPAGAGDVLVGVATHKLPSYGTGQASRRAMRRADTGASYPAEPFRTFGDDVDVSFSLTLK